MSAADYDALQEIAMRATRYEAEAKRLRARIADLEELRQKSKQHAASLVQAHDEQAERAEKAERELEEARDATNRAYGERNRLVAALSAVYPSHLQRHSEDDVKWEDDWGWIVVVLLPTGQATWHIHDSELAWFDHLDRNITTLWDGHTTEEKYRRLDAARAGEEKG